MIELEFLENYEKPLRNKGKSILDFPDDFTVIDIETTGLDCSYDHIIEVAGLKVRSGKVVDTFNSLLRPADFDELDPFISDLTGITEDMISSAPDTSNVIKNYYSFIGDDILIGHNISGFDVNFIYDALANINIVFDNDYVDTLRVSRHALPELEHHRLCDLTDYYSVDSSVSHRALSDCNSTLLIYDYLRNEILQKFITFDNFKEYCKKHKKQTKAAEINPSVSTFDSNHPLYQKECVITGKLSRATRKQAMQLLADVGALNRDTVTKDTRFLILGNNDYCKTVKNGKSSKHKKAEKLILNGQDLQIISENTFYDLIKA